MPLKPSPRPRDTGAVGTVVEGGGLVDNKAFLLEVLLNHFADRDSQIQQVRTQEQTTCIRTCPEMKECCSFGIRFFFCMNTQTVLVSKRS